MLTLDTTKTSLVGMFFLYLVILSESGSSKLLNCKVQYAMKNNIYMQHFILFLSIFIFTFILNWYTPSSLVLTNAHGGRKNTPEDFVSEKYTYLFDSLKNAILLYILFLFSTKLTEETTLVFFILMFVLFILFIVYRVELDASSINEEHLSDYFISKTYLNQLSNGGDTNLLFYLHNGMSLGYLSAILNMVYGIVQYYKKQTKDHVKDWSFLKFVFGSRKCDNL